MTPDDFVVVTAERPVPCAALFTKSRFAGPSVVVSREHVSNGVAQAVVVISKNSNVATGQAGHNDAVDVATGVGDRLGVDPTNVVVTSTGVIGRRYPIDRVRAGIAALPPKPAGTDAHRSCHRHDDHRHGGQGVRSSVTEAMPGSSVWPRVSG